MMGKRAKMSCRLLYLLFLLGCSVLVSHCESRAQEEAAVIGPSVVCIDSCKEKVSAGKTYKFKCRSVTPYPASTFRWQLVDPNNKSVGPLNSSWSVDLSGGRWSATSEVSITIQADYNNTRLVCTVFHPTQATISTKITVVLALAESHLMRLILVLGGSAVCVLFAICIAVYAVSFMFKKKDRRARNRDSPVELGNLRRKTSHESQAPSRIVEQRHRCFPRERINLLDEVGEGSFGVVYRATADGIVQTGQQETVAVKTLKAHTSSAETSEFMKELNVCVTLRPHPHIISMLGFNTTQEPYYLIFEFASNGNLYDFLQEKKNRWIASRMTSSSFKAVPVKSSQILKFACQIASGMDYLASMKIIHRDLAARNILLTETLSCKISDFGFSRDVFFEGNYEMSSQGVVPIRWMALESVLENTYTTKSDVWSYGILVWEIITLGTHPYNGIEVRALVEALRDGKRLGRPAYCGQKLYDIMKECWHPKPTNRPEFRDILQRLYALYANPKRHLKMAEFKPVP